MIGPAWERAGLSRHFHGTKNVPFVPQLFRFVPDLFPFVPEMYRIFPDFSPAPFHR
jgi:hypothetical protein